MRTKCAVQCLTTVSARSMAGHLSMQCVAVHTFAVIIVQIVRPAMWKSNRNQQRYNMRHDLITTQLRRRDKLPLVTLGPGPGHFLNFGGEWTSSSRPVYLFIRLTRVFFCQNSVNLFLCIANCCEFECEIAILLRKELFKQMRGFLSESTGLPSITFIFFINIHLHCESSNHCTQLWVLCHDNMRYLSFLTENIPSLDMNAFSRPSSTSEMWTRWKKEVRKTWDLRQSSRKEIKGTKVAWILQNSRTTTLF